MFTEASMSAQIGGINGGYQNSFTVVVWKSAGSGQKVTPGDCNGARICCVSGCGAGCDLGFGLACGLGLGSGYGLGCSQAVVWVVVQVWLGLWLWLW